MMLNNQITKLSQTLLSGLLTAGVLISASTAQAAVSQAPLNLVEGVSPNMLLTLDDSGSMRFSFTPDSISKDDESRKAKSSTYNPAYYNPKTIYSIPPFFNENGSERKLDTSFDAAYHNGFRQSVGSTNLSRAYQVAWDIPVDKEPTSYDYGNNTNYTGIGYTNRLAENPSLDFDMPSSIYIGLFGGAREYTNTQSGIVFTIERNWSSSCSATAKIPGFTETFNANCSGSLGNFKARLSDKPVPAYYYTYEPAMSSSCTINNDSCYKLQFVKSAEKQNFANWYSFYRNRALSTLSAASVAFYNLSSNVRLSWQALTNCSSFNSSKSGCGNNKFRSYSTQHKGSLYNWFSTMEFDGGTPLRAAMDRAGKFLMKDIAWLQYLDGEGVNTDKNKYACRSSYHILMTDGMWNGDDGSPSGWFRHDNRDFQLPDKKMYKKVRPYKSSVNNTLADLAMHYWATDLSDLDNNVPSYIPYKNLNADSEYWDPRNNPATWQHMSNFIVGLALTQSLKDKDIPWAGSTHAGQGYQNLLIDVDWPSTIKDGSDENVYDLWHAAINSRGEFYSVESPDAMVQAFQEIIARIAERQSTAALPDISAEVESDETDPDSIDKLASIFYNSSFDSKDWSGDLEKIKKYVTYTDGVRNEETESVWKASNKLPEHENRKIYIAGSGSNKLQEFTTTNVDSIGVLKDALNTEPGKVTADGKWEKRLNFLRGDKSNEGSLFRERETVIGEFLDSSPVLVSGARYLTGFGNKIEGDNHSKYSAFAAAKKSRKAQVYIGGNDGMLHAFDAKSGEETFAFIPTAVFPNLNRLTDPKYSESHHFYVNGTPEVADVYDGTNWRTILVGTLRAGGKGIFALDITEPDKIKLLWELNENSPEFKGKVKPGYSFPKPTIARLHNGRWAVVTGNGIENGDDSGKAALYIIDAITGELTKSLEVKSAKANNNGLSTPKLVDFDADGIADYAYAGDMHGNLWRFDLLGASEEGSIYGGRTGGTNKFKVSYGGDPMFTALSSEGRPQMITAPPSIVRHPDRASYLVVFGTGKYYEEGDKGGDLSSAQTLYAVWDQKTMAEDTPNALTITRSNLVKQSFGDEVTGENAVAGVTRQGRTLTKTPVDWQSNRGWLLDLQVGSKLIGEMLINDMQVVGRTLLFSTLVPNDDPCAHGAGNWLYAINPFTGGRTERHVFDTRGPNAMVLSGIKFGDPGGVPLTLTPGGLEVPSSSGPEGINIAEMTGRQTWRVVPDP